MEHRSAASSPAISLPKGGGAIKGIGETFQPNLFTGTGNFSVPIYTSPGRNGFGPQLSLQYSSGNGNGPFGLGWRLSIPRITRKTEKGLPTYTDKDVFVMSGAEDLVPCLDDDGNPLSAPNPDYAVTRYRPRTEGLFARIECWRHKTDGKDVFWRATTKENVTSVYGRTAMARIVDPEKPAHIFEWLLEETFDARGNHILYEYVQEDPELELGDEYDYEHNRSHTQAYIRRILYGNTPDGLAADKKAGPERKASHHLDLTQTKERHYLFEMLFDYFDLPIEPLINHDWRTYDHTKVIPSSWDVLRPDPFSTFRSGFEARTLRRCRRVLMLHHFKEGGLVEAPLVKSTDFDYSVNEKTQLSFLSSVTLQGFRKDPTNENRYLSRDMPPVTFTYSAFEPEKQTYRAIKAENGDLPPLPLNHPGTTLLDIFGDGLPDVVQSVGDGIHFWENRGQATLGMRRPQQAVPAGVSWDQPNVSVGDMGGDGLADLIVTAPPMSGFYESTPEGGWTAFKRFEEMPTFDLADPNTRLVDLTGDGLSDVLVTRDEHFLWYQSKGEAGYEEGGVTLREHDLDKFPDVYFDDPAGRVRLADMTGDGLNDIVLVHDGRIDYWPNKGYGRFGKRITMRKAPHIGHGYDPRRLFLADLDGNGCADLVYVDMNEVHFWFNQSGNAWSKDKETITGTPFVTDSTSVQFTDFFGTGTACLVWSYDYGTVADGNYKVLDFCGCKKPNLLVEMDNHMGATTRAQYASSIQFYLEDKKAGRPWLTNLPFPVQVLEKTEVIDHISKTKLVSTYKYHHGYYDGREREFRGFGRVDRFDTEYFNDFSGDGLHADKTLFENDTKDYHVPPVETRTWHHTGIYFDPERCVDHEELSRQYRREYYKGDDAAFDLNGHRFEQADGTEGPGRNPHEAFRALRGAVLRTEVYARDETDKDSDPYTVTENRYWVQQLQPGTDLTHGVYLSTIKEAVTYHYERHPQDPRIGHQLNLDVDDCGNITESIAIGYPRRQVPDDLPEQGRLQIVYTRNDFINKKADATDDAPAHHYIGIPCQSRAYEITGIPWQTGDEHLKDDAFEAIRDASIHVNPGTFKPYAWQRPPDETGVQRRLIEWSRTYFRSDALPGRIDPIGDLEHRLDLGKIAPLGLPYESYQAAFTDELLQAIYEGRQAEIDLAIEGGYHPLPNPAYPHPEGAAVSNYHWIPSGRQGFDQSKFYMPQSTQDPFGNQTTVQYDDYGLLVTQTRDALPDQQANIIQARNDYRVLQPCAIIDPNGNHTQVSFDALGLVAGTAAWAVDSDGQRIEGDSLEGFTADLDQETIDAHLRQPLADPHAILKSATSRLVYDLKRYQRALAASGTPQPNVVYTLARETHATPEPETPAGIQHSFTYSDGFGREIQKKIQAEPGPLVEGGPVVDPRWVGTGATVFNNKGKPVKQYEPFFSDTHEFGIEQHGVSPILFYDPLERVVCTLHPNHTYEKVVFDAWKQTTWDVNDTIHASHRNDSQVLQNFTPIEAPGTAGMTFIKSINKDGQMAGDFRDSARIWHSFLYDQGESTLIDFPGAACTRVTGINNKGRMVGIYVKSDDPNIYHGFIKDGDTFSSIDHPDAIDTFLCDINDTGQIAGCYDIEPGIDENPEFKYAFLMDQGDITPIDFPDAPFTLPCAINNSGQIVGCYEKGDGIEKGDRTLHGFLLDNGVFTTIDFPGVKNTCIMGIDDTGRMVGGYGPSKSEWWNWYAFILENGIFTKITKPGTIVYALSPMDINAAGLIGGWYWINLNGNISRGFAGTLETTSPYTRYDPTQDEDVGCYFLKLDQTAYLPTWYNLRTDDELALQRWADTDSEGNPLPEPVRSENARRRASEKKAALNSAKHAATPTATHLDTLGRAFLTIADNGHDPSGNDVYLKTHITLDIEGSDLKITDPRQYELNKTRVEADQVHNFVHAFDMAGRKLRIDSVDAGLQLVFMDAAQNPLYSWDAVGRTVKTRYDQLRRPTQVWVREKSAPDFYLAQKTIYGEVKPEAHLTNHRLQAWKVYDGAGLATSEAYDFKGNLIEQSRRLLSDGTRQVQWPATGTVFYENGAAALLEPEENKYTATTQYDALNRIVISRAPDDTTQEPRYNEANLLDSLKVTVNGEEALFVENIDYNAKGQRTRIRYGNKVTTEYTYDPETFRLTRLISKRQNAADPDLQNLHYTYDPVGNITTIRDDAHQNIFNHNTVIEPQSNYTYDPLYRLVTATGREHEAMTACHYRKPDQKHTEFIPLTDQPTANGRALCNYYEHYAYDTAGNITEIKHRNNTRHTAWTRHQTYAPDSNRLKTSQAGCPDESAFDYLQRHDPNGNITGFPHLPAMQWDFRNQLVQVQLNVGENPDKAYYQYDTAGQRVRKLLLKNNGGTIEERIYLGGYEIYRKRNGATSLRRDTIHVMDDKNRIALVETEKDYDEGSVISSRVRYQLSNHLGSAVLGVDKTAAARVISYEEYYPYGGSAYMAGMDGTEAKQKRYRYSGKERDDETGFYYFGARYYLVYFGIWLGADPDYDQYVKPYYCFSQYNYAVNNPLRFTDPDGKEPKDSVYKYRICSSCYYDTQIENYKELRSDIVKVKSLFEANLVEVGNNISKIMKRIDKLPIESIASVLELSIGIIGAKRGIHGKNLNVLELGVFTSGIFRASVLSAHGIKGTEKKPSSEDLSSYLMNAVPPVLSVLSDNITNICIGNILGLSSTIMSFVDLYNDATEYGKILGEYRTISDDWALQDERQRELGKKIYDLDNLIKDVDSKIYQLADLQQQWNDHPEKVKLLQQQWNNQRKQVVEDINEP